MPAAPTCCHSTCPQEVHMAGLHRNLLHKQWPHLGRGPACHADTHWAPVQPSRGIGLQYMILIGL